MDKDLLLLSCRQKKLTRWIVAVQQIQQYFETLKPQQQQHKQLKYMSEGYTKSRTLTPNSLVKLLQQTKMAFGVKSSRKARQPDREAAHGPPLPHAVPSAQGAPRRVPAEHTAAGHAGGGGSSESDPRKQGARSAAGGTSCIMSWPSASKALKGTDGRIGLAGPVRGTEKMGGKSATGECRLVTGSAVQCVPSVDSTGHSEM